MILTLSVGDQGAVGVADRVDMHVSIHMHVYFMARSVIWLRARLSGLFWIASVWTVAASCSQAAICTYSCTVRLPAQQAQEHTSKRSVRR